MLGKSLRKYAYVIFIFYPLLKCSTLLGWYMMTVKRGLISPARVVCICVNRPVLSFDSEKGKLYAQYITRKDRQCIYDVCKTLKKIPHSDKMRIRHHKLMKIK